MTKEKQAAEPVPQEVNQMPSATRELYFRIQAIYETATDNELMKRYEIGEIVNLLTSDEKKYGQDILTPVSDALGVGVDFLYRTKKLANTWSRREIETLRSRRNSHGRRIEFTHLLLIATVPASKTRESLIEEFFGDGLTTRELEQRIKKLIGKSKSNQLRRPKSPAAGLSSMQKAAADYSEKFAVWYDVVFEPIEDIASNGGDIEYFDDLLGAKKSQEELKQRVEQTIEHLNKCIRVAEQARKERKRTKRHIASTTPARPAPLKRPAKASPAGRRRRVVV